jgi:uncharacterized protein (TIGR03000 family)
MPAGRCALCCLAALLLTASACFAQRFAQPAPVAVSATVEVRLPDEAELWFDGSPTTQTGDRRVFTTPPLRPGLKYAYDVMVRWRDGGYDVVRRERLLVRAGEALTLEFVRPTRRDPGMDHVAISEIVPASTSPAARQPPPRRLPGHVSIIDIESSPRGGSRPTTRIGPAVPGHMAIVEFDEPGR